MKKIIPEGRVKKCQGIYLFYDKKMFPNKSTNNHDRYRDLANEFKGVRVREKSHRTFLSVSFCAGVVSILFSPAKLLKSV